MTRAGLQGKVLLSVPNVSEGRDTALIRELAAAVASCPGVRLLNHSHDRDHHRSVYAYLGEPEAVLDATKALASLALDRIDMRRHSGEHPRLGALDVVPFVPVRDVSEQEAVEITRRFGRFVAARGIPVYYYEAAALRPERRALPEIRRGGYEGLAAKLARPEGRPDEGPASFHPKSGAVVTGVRGPLIAFNVNLLSDDVELAQAIARAVRERDGGLPGVRAIGVALRERGMTQVAMNLTDPSRTGLHTVLEAVRTAAAQRGVEVAGSELIGPVPLEAVVDLFRASTRAAGFRSDQIVELGFLE
ncbi:MAG: glutamate formimidoyltransferase [Gemmatimonadota bacterium]